MKAVTMSELMRTTGRNEPDPRMYQEHGCELDPVLYETRQWSVTEFGIENHRGPWHYYIPWADIRPTPKGAHGWEQHMAEKTWVDTASFNDAFRMALKMKLSGYQPPDRKAAE